MSNSALASIIDLELSDPVQRSTSPLEPKNKGSMSEFFQAPDLISLDLEWTMDLNESTKTIWKDESFVRFLVLSSQISQGIKAIHGVFTHRSYWNRLWVV
jgi:hypothetical protein